MQECLDSSQNVTQKYFYIKNHLPDNLMLQKRSLPCRTGPKHRECSPTSTLATSTKRNWPSTISNTKKQGWKMWEKKQTTQNKNKQG